MGEGTDIVSVPEQRSEQGKAPSTTHEKLVVSDILGKTRDINVFASLTRGFETLSNRLESDSLNATVLAPTNTAIEQLPHKPWENLDDYAKFGANEAYAGKAGEDRATDNLRKFVEAHVIPESPWPEKKEASNLVGQKLYWEKGKDGNIRIHPGDIEVSRIVAQVSNALVAAESHLSYWNLGWVDCKNLDNDLFGRGYMVVEGNPVLGFSQLFESC